jgi:hypothetical protein
MNSLLNVNRVAFSIGDKEIYWYGIIMCLAIIVSIIVAMFLCKRKKINTELPLNIALIVLTPLYFILAVGFGWLEFLSLPIALCNLMLCAVQIPAIIFSSIYWNLEYHKVKFVVLTKNKSGKGFYSSFYTIFEICGLFAFAIYNILLAI